MVDLSLPACLWALSDYGSPRANEEMLVPLPCKRMANIVKRGLLCATRNCVVSAVAVILAFACNDETDWTVFNPPG